MSLLAVVSFFQAEDGIRDRDVTGVQTCALPICDVVHFEEDMYADGNSDFVAGSFEELADFYKDKYGADLYKRYHSIGLDPDNLPESDPSAMNFGGSEAKAWKDIWGSGQGIGSVKSVQSAGDYIDQLIAEYTAAKAKICS